MKRTKSHIGSFIINAEVGLSFLSFFFHCSLMMCIRKANLSYISAATQLALSAQYILYYVLQTSMRFQHCCII